MSEIGQIRSALAKLSAKVMGARPVRQVGLTLDGGGSPITTGYKGATVVAFAGRIIRWCILADQTGSLVVDVWKCPFASAPPDSGDSITGSSKPTLSSQQKAEGYPGTLWAADVQPGDVIAFNVESASGVQRATLCLWVSPT